MVNAMNTLISLVQGWDCEINAVNFRAIVRMVFKPLMEALPIVGGLELYLISMPSLDYNLGGMVSQIEAPNWSIVIKRPRSIDAPF